MIFMVKELQVELEYKKISYKFLVPLAQYVKAQNMCKIFSLIPSKKTCHQRKMRQTTSNWGAVCLMNTKGEPPHLERGLASRDNFYGSSSTWYFYLLFYLENVADVIGGRLYGEVDRKAPDAWWYTEAWWCLDRDNSHINFENLVKGYFSTNIDICILQDSNWDRGLVL